MKIVSKFKDYYDYISNQYGHDSTVTYIRGKISRTEVEISGIPWNLIPNMRNIGDKDPQNGMHTHRSYVPLLIAGEYSFPLYIEEEFEKEDKRLAQQYGPGKWKVINSYILDETPDGMATLSDKQIQEIQRLIESPVFIITEVLSAWRKRGQSIRIQENCPVLQNLGLPAKIPADQMWQNIYTTFTSVIRKNPDLDPPVEISNDNRIIAAGFDQRTSFRHPIKFKK